MSYTTRCPACGTTFRVVPDQLKISDGWVRCGHCSDVFDARLYLEAWTPPTRPATVVSVPPTSGPQTVPAPPAQAPALAADQPARAEAPNPLSHEPEPARAPLAPSVAEPAAAMAPQPHVSPQRPDHAAELEAWLASLESMLDEEERAKNQASGRGGVGTADAQSAPPFAPPQAAPSQEPKSPAQPAGESVPPSAEVRSPEVPIDPTPEPEQEPDFQTELRRFAQASSAAVEAIRNDPPSASEPTWAAAQVGAVIEPDDAVVDPPESAQELLGDEPGFVRQAKRQAFWRSPGMRAALGLLVLALAALLVAQWAVHERDQLAASHPPLVPVLERLCQPLGCEIGPARRIEAVVIDSSTLARKLGHFYAFDLVLKNTADMPVATPALELSLTDSRDAVFVRRVFVAEEMPDTPRQLPARGSLSLSLRLSISDTEVASMTGYRALVFYP